MKKSFPINKTTLRHNTSEVEESIEIYMRRIMNNKEGISDAAPTVYTERKDGVIPDYDIRTDRIEIAAEAMSKSAKANWTKRTEKHSKKTIGEQAKEGMNKEQGGEAKGQSTNATPE